MTTEITRAEWSAIQQVYIGSMPFRRFYDSQRSKIPFPFQWAEDRTLASGINGLFKTSVYPDGAISGVLALPELPIPLLSDRVAAHELTHPILHGEGFPTVYTRDGQNATINAALSSLLTDRVINRRLTAYGFDLATHCTALLDSHRRNLESVTSEPKQTADRLLWICNIVAALLEAQQTGIDTADYRKWIASRYPKIARAALRALEFIKRSGYQTPNQHRKILQTLASDYQIRDVRIGSLAEMIALARRKGQAIQIAADGATWSTEEQLSSTVSTDTGLVLFPGLHVSSKTAGLAYTSIMTGSNAAAPAGAGRKTVDSGDNWTALSNPAVTPNTLLAGDIHSPFNDNASEGLVYFGQTAAIWTETFNFALTDGDFTVHSLFDGAVWTGGVGWVAGDQTTSSDRRRCAVLVRTLDSFTLTSVTMTYDLTKGTFDGAPSNCVFFVVDTVNFLIDVESDVAADGTNLTQNWSGTQTGTDLLFGLNSSYDNAAPFVFSGSGTIKQLVLTGTGVNPFTGLPAGRQLIRVNATTPTNVSPVHSGEGFGPWYPKSIAAQPSNRQSLLLVGGNEDQSLFGVWRSADAGDHWTLLATPGGDYRSGSIADDGSIYMWGESGSVGIGSLGGATIDERGPGGSARIVGITGD